MMHSENRKKRDDGKLTTEKEKIHENFHIMIIRIITLLYFVIMRMIIFVCI